MLPSPVINAGLTIQPLHSLEDLLSCTEDSMLELRLKLTGGTEMNGEEASLRFSLLLDCATGGVSHTEIPYEDRRAVALKQMKMLANTDYLRDLSIYDFYARMRVIDWQNYAWSFDDNELFRRVIRYFHEQIEGFYRHAAVAFLKVSAGIAFSDRFTIRKFSVAANIAFLAQSFDFFGLDPKKRRLDKLSHNFEVTKSLMLLVPEDDFCTDGLTDEEIKTLYMVTRMKSLLDRLNPSYLAELLEEEIGL